MLKSQQLSDSNKFFNKFPSDFDEDDKLIYEDLFEKSLKLFPNFKGNEWIVKMELIAYIREQKKLSTGEEVSLEDLNNEVKNLMTNGFD